MSKEVYVVEHHKDRSGWWTILAAAAIMALWQWFLFAGVVVCIAWLARRGWLAYQEHRTRKFSRDAAIALRADHEHQMALAGDPLGIYGQYTPATMPITSVGIRAAHMKPMVAEFIDYDDGLKDWE